MYTHIYTHTHAHLYTHAYVCTCKTTAKDKKVYEFVKEQRVRGNIWKILKGGKWSRKWLHYTLITKIKEIFFLKNRTRKYRSSSTSRYESVHKGFKQNINRMGKEGISISKYESKNHL